MSDDIENKEPSGDTNFFLSELSKAQKGEAETDEAKELDVKDFDKMTERDFISKLHDFITGYLSKPKRSDNGPSF
jgi:AAA+ ATPase superfamily predicted ATPase